MTPTTNIFFRSWYMVVFYLTSPSGYGPLYALIFSIRHTLASCIFQRSNTWDFHLSLPWPRPLWWSGQCIHAVKLAVKASHKWVQESILPWSRDVYHVMAYLTRVNVKSLHSRLREHESNFNGFSSDFRILLYKMLSNIRFLCAYTWASSSYISLLQGW